MKAAKAQIQLRAIRLRRIRHIPRKAQAIPARPRKPEDMWESIT
jgi:hypothetical protein